MFTLYNPTKFKAPRKCKGCGARGSVKRTIKLDDRQELVYIKKGNQTRTLINGKWKKIHAVSTVAHTCTKCKMRDVKWRHIKRVNEKRSSFSRILGF